MTEHDFRTWLARHCALWPVAKDYLCHTEYGRDRCAAWYEVLKLIDLQVALQASVDLLAGTQPQPRGVSGHPAAIIEHARRIAGIDRPRRDPTVCDNMRRYDRFRRLRAAGKSLDEIWDTVDGMARST